MILGSTQKSDFRYLIHHFDLQIDDHQYTIVDGLLKH